MYLKIRRNYGERWSEIPEIFVECDRFDRRAYDKMDRNAEHAESMFPDEDGEVHPLYTIHTYKNRKFSDMLLIGHATIFVMGDDGKTIDTIYT